MHADPTGIPYGYCHCGCGQKTTICQSTHLARGYVRGEPVRFLAGHHARREPGWTAEDRGYLTPCWIWQGSFDTWGYGSVMRDGVRLKTHRIAWATAHGPIPKGMLVLHRCDVPACCNPEHLFLGTDADNSADMVAKGRQAKRSRNGNAKLTEADVAAIRASSDVPRAVLAERFGISVCQIGSIRGGRAWFDPEIGSIARRRSILTIEKAREIRASSESRRVLAQRYGVAESTIGNVLQGRAWPEAEDLERERRAA